MCDKKSVQSFKKACGLQERENQPFTKMIHVSFRSKQF